MLVLVALVSTSCVDMNIGKSFVLCSQIAGTLIDKERRPVPGVRVQRTWKWAWNGRTGSEETATDAQGRFAFPQVTGRSLTAGVLSHEPAIDQEITAHGPLGPVLIFAAQKMNYDDNGENDGRPLDIVCLIDKAPGRGAGFWGTVVELK